MKNINIFYVLFAMLAVFAAPANATDLTETTCTNDFFGAWNSSTNTCTVNIANVTDIYDINNGITLIINGGLANWGTIHINDGGFLKNFGNIFNMGTIFIACGGTFTGNNPDVNLLTIEFGCSKPNPVTDIQNLINDVETLNIQHGIENSLVVKLNAAIQDLQDNNNAEAIIHLQDFINEVNALRGKKITESEADILIAAAQAIISQLTGP